MGLPALTDRQRALLDHLASFVAKRGYAPSLQEIAHAFGFSSLQGVKDHLKALERKGYVRRRPGQRRAITLMGQPRLPAHSLTRACAGPQDPRPRRRALPHLPVTSRAGGLAMMTEQRAAQRLLSSNAAAVLLRGDPAVRTLAMDLAAATIMAEGTVLWIEAANQFDLYAFAEAAKRWGDPPETLLKRLRIARAFTIYQLGALATDGP